MGSSSTGAEDINNARLGISVVRAEGQKLEQRANLHTLQFEYDLAQLPSRLAFESILSIFLASRA
jgi:hypothetical protein